MIEFATMDAQVAYKYVEGDEELLSWMTRDAVKNMQVDVELVVSQQFTHATVEASRLAEEIAVKYASYSPDMQMRVRPLFKSSLMALGHDDVDVLLPKPTREDFVRYQAGMIEGADETVQAGDPAA